MPCQECLFTYVVSIPYAYTSSQVTAKLTGSLLGLAERVSSRGKDLVKVVLEPSNIRAQSGELPYAIDLLVPVLVVAVGMTLDGDRGTGLIRVLLMGYAQLMVTNNLVVRHLLPLGTTNEVLRLQKRVTQHVGVGCHCDKLCGRHGFPDLVKERAVVDPESGSNASLEFLPVLLFLSIHVPWCEVVSCNSHLGVVAVCPIVAGGHAAKHFYSLFSETRTTRDGQRPARNDICVFAVPSCVGKFMMMIRIFTCGI